MAEAQKIREYTEAELSASDKIMKTAPTPIVIGDRHLTDALRTEIAFAMLGKIQTTHLMNKAYEKMIAVDFHRSESRISITLPQIIAEGIVDWTVEFTFEAINTNISLIFDDTNVKDKQHSKDKTWMGGWVDTPGCRLSDNTIMSEVRDHWDRKGFHITEINRGSGQSFYLTFEFAKEWHDERIPAYHQLKQVTFSNEQVGTWRPFANFFANVDCCNLCFKLKFQHRPQCKCITDEGSSSSSNKRPNKFEALRAKKARK